MSQSNEKTLKFYSSVEVKSERFAVGCLTLALPDFVLACYAMREVLLRDA